VCVCCSSAVRVMYCRDIHGPGPGPRARPDQARPGLGLVAQIMFGSGPGSGLVQMIAIVLYRTFRAFSGHFFRKKKIVVALILCSWHIWAPETNPTTWFSGDLHSSSLPEIVRDILQTRHPISLYRSENAKITSDVFRAPLNSSFEHYWHICIKINMY
jgi:hypothetical protein